MSNDVLLPGRTAAQLRREIAQLTQQDRMRAVAIARLVAERLELVDRIAALKQLESITALGGKSSKTWSNR